MGVSQGTISKWRSPREGETRLPCHLMIELLRLIPFPFKDELAVRLEGSKACLQCSQHRYGHLGVVTFPKCICNNFALAGDAVLALGDEPLSLG